MTPIEKRLRERIKFLEKDREELRVDRDIYRTYFSEKLRYFISLLADKRYAPSAWMVEDLAKMLQRTQ